MSLRIGFLLAVGPPLLVVAGCGGRSEVTAVPDLLPAAPYAAPLAKPGPARVLTARRRSPAAVSRRRPGVQRYEYVFPGRAIAVYESRPPFRLVERISLPAARSYRGIAVSPRTGMLYLSLGGNGGSSGTGALLAYDLLRDRVLWERRFPTGTDSLAVTPDGRTIFLPTGERTPYEVWYVIAARTGVVTRELRGGPGPHNTIVGPGGARAYLGPRNGDYLVVAATRPPRVLRRVGPLRHGVRPFTLDERRGLAYTTATGFLGFQQSSLRTGRVLATVPIRGFHGGRSLGTPSHGISLSPDGLELYVIDVPNSYVHVFDVGNAPRQVADIRLRHPMRGLEVGCVQDCGKAGWLQHSLDGKYVYVGDDGDVVATGTRKVVGYLKDLASSRYMIEIDWRGGVPVATSTRSGVALSQRSR